MAKKRLDEDDILSKVTQKTQSCVSWADSKLSRERERVTKYYEGQSPLPAHDGNSKYVSSDVYDSVEMMKAQLLETFANGHDVMRFRPRGEGDVLQAQVETAYTSYLIFEANNGFDLCHDVIHDGLTARKGVAEVYWDEDFSYEEQEFQEMPHEDAMALSGHDEIDKLDANLDDHADPAAPTYSGTYSRKIDHSKVCVEPVPPEEFFVESRVKRREDGARGRRMPKTKAELVALGYPKEKIDKISWDDTTLSMTPEVLAREKAVASDSPLMDDPVQEELSKVLLYQTYLKLALKGDGTACLYRVVHTESVLFEVEEVDEDPYVEFNPLRRPHTTWGNNYGQRVVSTQNARTVLTRAILDHTVTTTNPRWSVVQGGLVNPRELLDNRFGGIVNTTRPDAINPLAQANLNPFVFETLSMLKDNKEENTGISSLSQGLNKDAISNQNAQGLVDTLITVSQIRQKIIARNFATFLRDLYLKVWKCAMQNDKRERIIAVAGNFVQVDPQAWADRREVSISMQLGYGERDKMALKKVELYKALSADPAAQEFFGSNERYKLIIDAVKDNGIDNYADYIKPPKTYQPPGPDPIEMGKVEAQKMTAQATLITAEAAAKKSDVAEHHEALRTQNDTAKTQATVTKMQRDGDRQDLDTVNRVDVSQREIELAEKVPPENQSGIFSANS
jgi:cell fate (sporulation/competence/biofilm development) regulator YlbF (YheA/YmcA/DUF963 family)